MKLYKFITNCAVASLLIGTTACNDSLDLLPLDRISADDYFRTEQDLQLFTNPFYNDILPKVQFKAQSDLYVCQNMSDELMGGSYRIVPSSGGGWDWSTLRRINTLLGNIDKCSDAKAVEKYTALARFFRAYFYADKVARFGDVPWYESELASNSDELYKARDSRELIMEKIIEDVDYAIAHLPRKAQEAEAPFRATKMAALALKSRFCLFEGTYRKYHALSIGSHDANYYLQLAAQAAQEAIALGDNKLYSTGHPEYDYNILFAQDDSSLDEYILSISYRYAIFNNSHDSNAHMLLSNQGRPGYTRKMVCMYLNADGTRFTDREGWQTMGFNEETQNRDPRLAQSIRTPGYHRIGRTEVLAPDLGVAVTGYQPIKFVQDPTAAGGNTDRASYSVNDLPVFRYAEVLLNFAEAKAELGTLTQADIDASINLIRTRAGMPGLNMADANANPDPYMMAETTGFPNVTGANKGVILEIRRERAVELMQEGFRWNDLMRWKAGTALNDRADLNYSPFTGMYIPGAGSYDFSGDGKVDVILYEAGSTKPQSTVGVQIYQIGKDIVLTQGNKGYICYHKAVPRVNFNENRDYLYPIPIHERTLNTNLMQNKGWNDGLSY